MYRHTGKYWHLDNPDLFEEWHAIELGMYYYTLNIQQTSPFKYIVFNLHFRHRKVNNCNGSASNKSKDDLMNTIETTVAPLPSRATVSVQTFTYISGLNVQKITVSKTL